MVFELARAYARKLLFLIFFIFSFTYLFPNILHRIGVTFYVGTLFFIALRRFSTFIFPVRALLIPVTTYSLYFKYYLFYSQNLQNTFEFFQNSTFDNIAP